MALLSCKPRSDGLSSKFESGAVGLPPLCTQSTRPSHPTMRTAKTPPVYEPRPQAEPFPPLSFSLPRPIPSSALPFHSVYLPNQIERAQRRERERERERQIMADAASYEEQRRRQMEVNKRKLEELQLHHLSAAVREAAAPKPWPVGPISFLFLGNIVAFCRRCRGSLIRVRVLQAKTRKPRHATGEEAEPLRRSGRVANLSEKPKYREVRALVP
jgi:hypothetical protein